MKFVAVGRILIGALLALLGLAVLRFVRAMHQRSALTLLLAFAIGWPLCAAAQPLDTLWTRTYSRPGSQSIYSMTPTADGGYALAGKSDYPGTENFYLMRLDANGDTLWTRRYRRDTSTGVCWAVRQTPDSGFILAGRTNLSPPDDDWWLVKTDPAGDTLWTRTFGGAGLDRCYALVPTADGGYALAGQWNGSGGVGSAYWGLVVTDSTGTLLWERTYQMPGVDSECRALVQLPDGGFLLGGSVAYWVESFGVLRTDANGDSLWLRSYGFGSTFGSRCNAIEPTTDGGYLLAGRVGPAPGWGFGVVRLTAGLQVVWARSYDDLIQEREANRIAETVDGGCLVAGSSTFRLLRLDASGDSLWTSAYHGTECWGLARRPDGRYALAGFSGDGSARDARFIMTTSELTREIAIDADTLQFPETMAGDSSTRELTIYSVGTGPITLTELVITDPLDFSAPLTTPVTIAPDSSLDLFVTFHPQRDSVFEAWLIIVSDAAPETLLVDLRGQSVADAAEGTPPALPRTFRLAQNHPNPFNATTTISFELPQAGPVLLELFDLQGRRVATLADQAYSAGQHALRLDGSRLASGIYFAHLRAGHATHVRKLVLLK